MISYKRPFYHSPGKDFSQCCVGLRLNEFLTHQKQSDFVFLPAFDLAFEGCRDAEVGKILKKLFQAEYFRTVVVEDATTVELCGALKVHVLYCIKDPYLFKQFTIQYASQHKGWAEQVFFLYDGKNLIVLAESTVMQSFYLLLIYILMMVIMKYFIWQDNLILDL